MHRNVRFATTMGVVLMLLSLSLFSVGCRPSPKQQAQDTASRFVAALDRGDGDGAKALLTDAARERSNEPGSMTANLFHDDKDKSAANPTTVGEAAVEEDGRLARVPITENEKDGKPTGGAILLRHTDDGWKVYGMAMPVADSGPMVTINLEHPEASMGEALGTALGAAFKGIGEGIGAMAKGFGEGLAAASRTQPGASTGH